MTPHTLNDDRLGRYLLQHLPDLKLPLNSTKVGYGQSNPTFFLDDANKLRYILRKKPTGTVISPVAHQVDREYKVLKALGSVERFPVPKVMEFVKGRIITDPNLSTLPPSERRSAWFSMISTLAWLHSIDPDSTGLSDFGKKTSFYTRHCNTFSRIEAQQARVKDISNGKELGRAHPYFDEIVDYIRKNAPSDRTCIVHGDYKFDNVVLHPTEPRVIAVLDWELSTLGHPLMDAVYAVSPYWDSASKSGIPGGMIAEAIDNQGKEVYDPENQAHNGMPGMDELMDEYARITGWNPRDDKWEIAKVFHLMRGSTISHGIQARTISGQASSNFSHIYFEYTKRGLNAALDMVRAMKETKAPRSAL